MTSPNTFRMIADDVPRGGIRYWVLISVASILGCNTGDAYAHVFGFLAGFPILALALFALLVVERKLSWRGQIYYWLAIVIVRTAATNLADFSAHQVGAYVAMAVLAVVLAVCVALRVQARRRDAAEASRPSELARVDLAYWGLMLLAGILGTVLGDVASFRSGLGLGGASIALSLVVAGILVLAFRGGWRSPVFYWSTIVCVRAAGTSAGDYFAKKIGLPWSTIVFAILLLALITAWKDEARVPRATSTA